MTSIRGFRRAGLSIVARRRLTASCVAALLLTLLPNEMRVSAQTATPPTVQTVLEQRVIRSLAVHPTETGRILVGNKGSSPGSGLVFESRDNGKSWRKIFDRENAYAIAVSGAGLWLATEKGLYRAAEPDAPWRLVESVPRGKFSAVAPSPDGGAVMLGDWSGGVHVLDVAGNPVGRLLAKRSVVHLRWSGSRLLVGTWGDGLALVDRR